MNHRLALYSFCYRAHFDWYGSIWTFEFGYLLAYFSPPHCLFSQMQQQKVLKFWHFLCSYCCAYTYPYGIFVVLSWMVQLWCTYSYGVFVSWKWECMNNDIVAMDDTPLPSNRNFQCPHWIGGKVFVKLW